MIRIATRRCHQDRAGDDFENGGDGLLCAAGRTAVGVSSPDGVNCSNAIRQSRAHRRHVPRAPAMPGVEPMTLGGTVNKTALSLFILLIAASYIWNRGVADPALPVWMLGCDRRVHRRDRHESSRRRGPR